MNGCQPDGSRRTAFRAAQPRATSRQPRASHGYPREPARQRPGIASRRRARIRRLCPRPRSRGVGNGVPGHPGEGDDAAPAGRHAGGMREPAGQPGRTRQRHRHMRSLMRATRHDAVHGTRAITRSPLARARSRLRRRPNRAVPSWPCNASRASGLKQSTCALLARRFRSRSAAGIPETTKSNQRCHLAAWQCSCWWSTRR